MDDLLIIGNGFDLDLGLQTKYSDFAKDDEYWPFDSGTTSLGLYLNDCSKIDTWFDLEKELGEYSNPSSGIYSKDDRMSFNLLTKALSAYLSFREKDVLKEGTCAKKVLHHILDLREHDVFDTSDDPFIYSFNYTDLNSIAERLGLPSSFKCQHVHGSLADNNIVLGFGDNVISRAETEFMRKSFNEKYNPPPIISAMMRARSIIFFGLSFGEVDYAYFNEFFNTVSSFDDEGSSLGGKELIFITYDEQSRLSILHNIHERTGNKTSQLLNTNRVHFIRTSVPKDVELLDSLLQKRLNDIEWHFHSLESDIDDIDS